MRPASGAGALVALVVLAGSVVLSLSVPLRSDVQFWVLAASFVPWAILGYLLALIVLLVLRRGASGPFRRLVTVAAVVSLLGVGLHAAWLAPSYVGEHAEGDPDLTVLGFNMHFGEADIEATTRLVEREDPDLIVLTEATPEAVQALAANGIGGPGSRWPHQGGSPLPSISGTVALSAYPLSAETAARHRDRHPPDACRGADAVLADRGAHHPAAEQQRAVAPRLRAAGGRRP